MKRSFACVCLALLVFVPSSFVEALIPIRCRDNATTTKVCCPAPPGLHLPCGGPMLGSCDRVEILNEWLPEPLRVDDRVHFPSRFFSHLCRCNGNRWGVDCSECKFGWTGRDCTLRKPSVVRRNLLSLTPQQRKLMRDVIDRSLTEPDETLIFIEENNRDSDPLRVIRWEYPSVQYAMVSDHRYGSRATLFNDPIDCERFGFLDFNHDGIGFLTWHRSLMLIWEYKLQKIAAKYFNEPNFALPYWDWVDTDHCTVCTDDLMGSLGQNTSQGVEISSGSPFGKWREFCVEPEGEPQCYGCHAAGPVFRRIHRSFNNLQFPTRRDIEWILNIPDFYYYGERESERLCSFHRACEGRCGPGQNFDGRGWSHNRIHNMLDGSMCCSGTSPSDPLFMVHHTQTDRIFEAWLQRYGSSVANSYPTVMTRPGHALQANLISWIPVMKHIDMFRPSAELGYVYDTLQFGQ